MEDFVKRLTALGLAGQTTHIMLRPEQYQFLQIDAPAVPPEELRAATRYQIREMIQTDIDQVMLDVMRVGDRPPESSGSLFVVVAANAVVNAAVELGDQMHWTVPVIDINETAQRNLQSLVARRADQPERAHATLVLVEAQQVVLTICANDELFYSRCFELPEGFLSASWGREAEVGGATSSAMDDTALEMPVGEYVPDYNVGGVSYGTDYSSVRPLETGLSAVAQADDERTQRFLVEVQRSFDVWDRTWSSKPLASVHVYAGERSAELANWLTVQLGQTVQALDVSALFAGLEQAPASDQAQCLPLLGLLLRN
ncbi:hypothetical protein GALL_539930 [mine drainage metagenome]|uniref:Competence protein A n=1 Tax=mine drainage metagenome TaxID=410659 RepID=A0A1J5P1J4_9ZZZZ